MFQNGYVTRDCNVRRVLYLDLRGYFCHVTRDNHFFSSKVLQNPVQLAVGQPSVDGTVENFHLAVAERFHGVGRTEIGFNENDAVVF